MLLAFLRAPAFFRLWLLRHDLSTPRRSACSNRAQHFAETAAIGFLTLIEAESLLFHIGVQVERLNRDIGSLQSALKKALEILDTIRVNMVPDILNRVVNHFMNIR